MRNKRSRTLRSSTSASRGAGASDCDSLAADSWSAIEVPLTEDLEAYEVEILDGPAVKRTLSTATTSALYTVAQQTADWSAPLAHGETLDIRIFQLSALVGRGAHKTVTLIL